MKPGDKFRYLGYWKSDRPYCYDRIVDRISYSTSGEISHVVSTNGVMYNLSEIEFEPIELIRELKLKKLGI